MVLLELGSARTKLNPSGPRASAMVRVMVISGGRRSCFQGLALRTDAIAHNRKTLMMLHYVLTVSYTTERR